MWFLVSISNRGIKTIHSVKVPNCFYTQIIIIVVFSRLPIIIIVIVVADAILILLFLLFLLSLYFPVFQACHSA